MEDEICGCFCKDSREECRQVSGTIDSFKFIFISSHFLFQRFEGNEGFTISDQRFVFSQMTCQFSNV